MAKVQLRTWVRKEGDPVSFEFVKVIEMPCAPTVGLKIHWREQPAGPFVVEKVEWDVTHECYNVDFETEEVTDEDAPKDRPYHWTEEVRRRYDEMGMLEHRFARAHGLCIW